MPIETGTYISDLNVSNPASNDTVDKADDHLRLLKSTIKTTFPNITGAVTPTHTQLNYVTGVTSALQTQLDNKQALDADLTAIAALAGTTGFLKKTALNTWSLDTGTHLVSTDIGVSVQAYDVELAAIAGLTSAADRLPYYTGSGTAALATFTAAGRALVDDADATAQRATLGLGTASTLNVGTAANNIVQLNGTAQLPAVDGSLLTGVGGMTLLATVPTTSGTTPTASGLTLTNYKKLYITFSGISWSLASQALRIDGQGISASATNAVDTVTGYIELDLFASIANAYSFNSTSPSSIVPITVKTSYTTATTSIVFSTNGAASFDAGSIVIYGSK